MDDSTPNDRADFSTDWRWLKLVSAAGTNYGRSRKWWLTWSSYTCDAVCSLHGKMVNDTLVGSSERALKPMWPSIWVVGEGNRAFVVVVENGDSYVPRS